MARLAYQYQAGTRVRPPRRDNSGKFRLLVIFAVIALITAGIIALILPRKTAVQPESQAADMQIQEKESTSAAEKSEKKSNDTPSTAIEKNTEKTPAESPAVEPLPEKTEKTEKKHSPGETFTQGDFPEKGKPWKNDPPETPAEIPASGENSAAWRNEARLLTEKHLDTLAKRGDIAGYTIRYRVKGGDSFSRIANRHHTTYDMIKHLSGFSAKHNANSLNVGRNLRLLPGPWHIVIEKSAKLLKLYAVREGREELFAVWDIGIGRANKTPEGEFYVASRIVNPAWTAPDGSIIAFGKPENPLGTRFLKLSGKTTSPVSGLGIHGTNDESSVTKSLSNGCIRMRNADAEILFAIIPVKSRVTIRN